MTSRQKGLSLVEVAVVVVVLGLLLGGVLKGQELVTTARVRSLIQQQDELKVAYFAFFDRYAALHQAILAGLLGNVGVKADADEGYQGARGIRFHLHPGSGLARKRVRWVLAAELTETSRLYARCAAIKPSTSQKFSMGLLSRCRTSPKSITTRCCWSRFRNWPSHSPEKF